MVVFKYNHYLSFRLACVIINVILLKLGLQKGRHYYIDFAVISEFAMLVLGFIGVRMSRYDWVLNRNYLGGKFESQQCILISINFRTQQSNSSGFREDFDFR